jgi:uncharacterized protein DUF6587
VHGMLDGLVVGVLLASSVVYAACSLGPKALRRRSMLAAAFLLRKLPGALHLQAVAQRLEAAAAQKAAGACGGCESCGSAQASTTATPGGTNSPEVRIPISTIGHR